MLYEFDVTELVACRKLYTVEADSVEAGRELAERGETIEDGERLVSTDGVHDRLTVDFVREAEEPYEPVVHTLGLSCGLRIATDGRTGKLLVGFPRQLGRSDAQLDALESLILAHAVAGVDVLSSAYSEGIDTALDAVDNWGHLAEPPDETD